MSIGSTHHRRQLSELYPNNNRSHKVEVRRVAPLKRRQEQKHHSLLTNSVYGRDEALSFTLPSYDQQQVRHSFRILLCSVFTSFLLHCHHLVRYVLMFCCSVYCTYSMSLALLPYKSLLWGGLPLGSVDVVREVCVFEMVTDCALFARTLAIIWHKHPVEIGLSMVFVNSVMDFSFFREVSALYLSLEWMRWMKHEFCVTMHRHTRALTDLQWDSFNERRGQFNCRTTELAVVDGFYRWLLSRQLFPKRAIIPGHHWRCGQATGRNDSCHYA